MHRKYLFHEYISDSGWSRVFQIGNLFGKHRSTIITLYNGAFDSSSAVFLIIKVRISNSHHLLNSYICQTLVLGTFHDSSPLTLLQLVNVTLELEPWPIWF